MEHLNIVVGARAEAQARAPRAAPLVLVAVLAGAGVQLCQGRAPSSWGAAARIVKVERWRRLLARCSIN